MFNLVAALLLIGTSDVEELLDKSDQVTVVVFIGPKCPLMKSYASRLRLLARDYEGRVRFVGIDPNPRESREDLDDFLKQSPLGFPVLQDRQHQIVQRLKATRTTEVVVVDRSKKVRYQGRIDDQFEPGADRRRATKHFLRDALEAVLADMTVAVPLTTPVGCAFEKVRTPQPNATVTYSKDTAPIFFRRCIACHRPGQVAPFSLITYEETAGRAQTIASVVREGRMPPWAADPRHGRFANDLSLTEQEKRAILDWVEQDCPKGNPADLPSLPSAPPDGWLIKPDRVYSMPEPFLVPADGPREHLKWFNIDPGLDGDVYIQSIQIKPRNHSIVHHAGVAAKPKGWGEKGHPIGPLGDYVLGLYLPGQGTLQLPPGFAKRLPAGWELVLDIHYVSNGTEQSDLTEIGVVFADASKVQHVVATKKFEIFDLQIPPFEPNHVVVGKWTLDEDLMLMALYPHFHLRGKSMQFDALYPDGTSETLLSVPRFDFHWQHRYVLTEAKLLPRGTVVTVAGTYDNSSRNPNNPDPSAMVTRGEESTDEMFHGYFEVYLPEEPEGFRRFTHAASEFFYTHAIGLLVFSLLVGGGLLIRRRLFHFLAARMQSNHAAG